jgi:ribonuclease E
MDPEQERVYGWMGLNPSLLLDPPPAGDNLVVRVVRPGSDAEAVLEEARQQLTSSGSRRRRRGRGGEGRPSSGELLGDGSADADSGAAAAPESIPSQGHEREGGSDQQSFSPPTPASDAPEQEEVATPGRRRRRSSQAFQVDHPEETASLPEDAPSAQGGDEQPAAAEEDGLDPLAESRRRRRRSSASV